MAQQQRDIGAENLARLGRQQYTYQFGVGTIGGNIWNWRQPTTMERLSGRNELIPELRPELRGRVNVMPAGRGSAQELQSMREAGGRPYVEAPELYRRGGGKSQLDRSDQFYSTVTGRSMGTLMGTGSYGGFGGGSKETPQPPTPPPPPPQKPPSSGGGPQPAQGPAPKPKTPPMPTGSYMSDQYGYGFTSQPMGFSGESAAFTPAGSSIGMRPSPTATSTFPPFPEFDTRDYLSGAGFGGIPRFPYTRY